MIVMVMKMMITLFTCSIKENIAFHCAASDEVVLGNNANNIWRTGSWTLEHQLLPCLLQEAVEK